MLRGGQFALNPCNLDAVFAVVADDHVLLESDDWEEQEQDAPAAPDTYIHWSDAEWIWSPVPRRLVSNPDLEDAADYGGGSDSNDSTFLPQEILARLPQYFFSPSYLRSLATCCKALRKHVLQPEVWYDKNLFLNDQEMQDPVTVRQMERLWSAARTITCTQTQLASMRQLPFNARIEWSTAPVRLDGRRHASIESTHCLLGSARLLLWLSVDVSVVYIGVKAPNSGRRSFVKIHDLFTERMGFSFGMAGQAPDLTSRPVRPSQLNTKGWNEFMLLWNERCFSVHLNKQPLGFAYVRADLPDGPAPHSSLFVWAEQPTQTLTRHDLRVNPLPSPVMTTLRIQCALCLELHPITTPQWRVCPECCTWICARHAEVSPRNHCPGCPLQLSDYIGGSNQMSVHLWRTAITPYRHAAEFFLQRGEELQPGEDKFENVVLQLLREHQEFLREAPLAVRFVPHPQAREDMSKRVWERVMFRARAILDFLTQKKDVLLFRFLHAEAEHLADAKRNPLLHLQHPSDVDGLEDWRSSAMDCALQLHTLLFEDQTSRSSRAKEVVSVVRKEVEKDWKDTPGGSLAADEALARKHDKSSLSWELSYSGGMLPPEILDTLPGFFFSFAYLRTLACVSQQMRRCVRDREHWRNNRIFLTDIEFQDELTLRSMVYFYTAARVCLVDVRQLAMFHIFPERTLLDWTASAARRVPRGVSGFTSDRPLMGFATFDLVLPNHAVGLYMGVQAWRGTNRAYCRADNLFREDSSISFALNDMAPQRLCGRERCQLRPEHSHRVELQWDQRTFRLSIDGAGISAALLPQDAENAVSPLARVFTWIHVRPRPEMHSAILRPVPSRVRLDPLIHCALCHRAHRGILLPRWAVCPFCDSWICRVHCAQTPTRLCPHCPNQLLDYVGGSHDQIFANAVSFFHTISLDEQAEKFSYVVREIEYWQDKLGGSLAKSTVTLPTHSQWFRLSEHRAIALRKRQEQRDPRTRLEAADEFTQEWNGCFSPYVCPTYGPGTSMIRLPFFDSATVALPILPEASANFLRCTFPAVKCHLLEQIHAHPRDQHIEFIQSTHTYLVNGKALPLSVTGLVHRFAQEFDADLAIQKMRGSVRWPRPEYSRVIDGSLVPLSNEEIKEKWATNSQDASSRGTWMHLQLEVCMNGGCADGEYCELDLFRRFLSQFQVPAIAFRTEWCIYSEQDQLAGCIDFVAKCSATEVIIFDWKRTKDLRSKYQNSWASMKSPLAHLPDCCGIHYRLQLNVYKYMLEKSYDLRVKAMLVVCLHPDNKETGPFVDHVPDMSTEVEAVLQSHRLSLSRQTNGCEWQEVSGGSLLSGSQSSFDRRIEEDLNQALDEDQIPVPEQPGPDSSALMEQDSGAPLSALVLTQTAGPDLAADATHTAARQRRFLPGAQHTADAFRSFFQKAESGFRESVPERALVAHDQRKRSIKDRSASQKAHVQAKFPHWSETLVRLAAGALEIYRSRYTDVFVRDFVALIWVMIGEEYLRAHNGVCFLYHDHGAFEPYTGIPPESIFALVKSYLQRLEGLFRLLPSTIHRTDESLLDNIQALLQQRNTVEELFNDCADAAVMCLGNSKRSAGRHKRQAEDAENEDAVQDVGSHSWTIHVAQLIAKIVAPLQRDLLEERRLLQYVAHWCNTPSQRQPGCAYADCCVKYDASETENLRIVNPHPRNNIYVRIPHPLCLKDPCLEAATVRLQKFFRETFWCNEDFFTACCAAIALAKRGLNIDRCFIGESPGGTGQSLYSSHLNAVYSQNHAFVDSNLFHNEDEMRKQLEQFAHCCMITAQEAPETNRTFQQDLFKKMVSADDLAARRPYGYITRMLRVMGWKRIETNQIMSFRNVKERNFNSILRRCLVWIPKALFVDADCLADYQDAPSDGIFPKDPTLRSFLEGGPAIAASLRMQHGFETTHSREDCYKVIDDCATAGPTEHKMREACGLQPRQAGRARERYRAPGLLCRMCSCLLNLLLRTLM